MDPARLTARATSGISWPSVFACAMTWLVFPSVLHAFDGDQSPDTWRSIWGSLLPGLTYWIVAFVLVSAIMHRLFAAKVAKLKGWRFWLFPFVSLPLAASMVFAIGALPWMLVGDPGFRLLDPVGMVGVLYYWAFALVTVLGTMLWLSYPLAILNQLVVRHFYNVQNGPG